MTRGAGGPDRLEPIDLVLAAAAAQTLDELATVRLAAIRSGHLLTRVSARPSSTDTEAGVTMLGGIAHHPHAELTLSARIGLIARRHGTNLGPGEDDGDS